MCTFHHGYHLWKQSNLLLNNSCKLKLLLIFARPTKAQRPWQMIFGAPLEGTKRISGPNDHHSEWQTTARDVDLLPRITVSMHHVTRKQMTSHNSQHKILETNIVHGSYNVVYIFTPKQIVISSLKTNTSILP